MKFSSKFHEKHFTEELVENVLNDRNDCRVTAFEKRMRSVNLLGIRTHTRKCTHGFRIITLYVRDGYRGFKIIEEIVHCSECHNLRCETRLGERFTHMKSNISRPLNMEDQSEVDWAFSNSEKTLASQYDGVNKKTYCSLICGKHCPLRNGLNDGSKWRHGMEKYRCMIEAKRVHALMNKINTSSFLKGDIESQGYVFIHYTVPDQFYPWKHVMPAKTIVKSKMNQLESERDLLDKNSKFKTEMCTNRIFQLTGICPYGSKCQFAHGPHELRTRCYHDKFKTVDCDGYHKEGFCVYGKRCHYIHRVQVTKKDDLEIGNHINFTLFEPEDWESKIFHFKRKISQYKEIKLKESKKFNKDHDHNLHDFDNNHCFF